MRLRLHCPAFDSFATLTPFSSFGVIPSSIQDELILFNPETDEVVDVTKYSGRKSFDGIMCRVSMVSLFGTDHMKVYWNSKQFYVGQQVGPWSSASPSWYYDGISESTFFRLFTIIMDLYNIEVPYNTFLDQSMVIDLDIKADFWLGRVDFHDWCIKYIDIPTSRLFYQSGKFHEKKMCSGVQFTNRNDATASKPFFKAYDKENELLTKSKDFTSSFLGTPPRLLKRFEVNLRNTLAITRFFPELGTKTRLRNILSLPPSRLVKVLSDALDAHVSDYTLPRNGRGVPSKLKPKDYALGALAYELTSKNGYVLQNIVGLISGIEDPSSKSRVLSRIKEAHAYFSENAGKSFSELKGNFEFEDHSNSKTQNL
jgi:hypothetical protein